MSLTVFVKESIKSIVNAGITVELSNIEQRRVRLINFIGVFGGAISVLFLVVFLAISNFWAWFPNLIVFGLSALGLYLNYKRRYQTAKYFFLSIIPTVIVILAWLHGEKVGVEHYLFFSSVFATALFDDFKTIFFFFLINVLSFGLCQFIFVNFEPVYHDQTFILANAMAVVCSFSLLLGLFYFFKHDLVLYAKNIEQKNDQLEKTNLKLTKSEKELKRLNETKAKIFSIISHDLKNPLSIIQSLSHMLHDNYSRLDDAYRFTVAKTIRNTIDSSYELIKNLLLWSKSHSHSIKVLPQDVNISFEIDKVFEFCRSQADKESIRLVSLVDRNTQAFADPFLLNIVLRNLITNAIKFSAKDEVVTVKCLEEEGELQICVIDTGEGIPLEHQNKLFALDSDLRTVGDSDKKGSGLGLILCKEFAAANGGRIGVESEAGKQTCFWFTVQKTNR